MSGTTLVYTTLSLSSLISINKIDESKKKKINTENRYSRGSRSGSICTKKDSAFIGLVTTVNPLFSPSREKTQCVVPPLKFNIPWVADSKSKISKTPSQNNLPSLDSSGFEYLSKSTRTDAPLTSRSIQRSCSFISSNGNPLVRSRVGTRIDAYSLDVNTPPSSTFIVPKKYISPVASETPRSPTRSSLGELKE